MKVKKHKASSTSDLRTDGWQRFERAVDSAVKNGPKHRPAKPKAAKGERKKPPPT